MKKLLIENIENYPVVLLYDTDTLTPDGFTDVTTDLQKWDLNCVGAKTETGSIVDYKVMRDNLKNVIFGYFLNPNYSNWGTVDAIVRQMASKHFFASYAMRLSQHSEQQDKDYFMFLYSETKGLNKLKLKGRPRILEEMWERVAVNYYRTETITQSQSEDFTLSTQDLAWKYLNYSSNHLKQWLSNEVGSEFENDGFAQKNYFSTTLRDELLNIYYGNY